VHVYLIDSGIWTAHPEFGGRADIVFDAFGLNGIDCSGHGTAVAGVVGSATYGVAKAVFLHGVRVYYECTPVGFASDVLAGVDWVAVHHVRPAVANLSVSLAPSTALSTAIRNLWNAGVFVAATAANHNTDACLEAGGASAAFTVAASTRSDAKAAFSNWGPCVDIYAPGEGIKTTWLGGFTNTLSGTSFATPHVTGVAALYKAVFGDAPSDSVASWIAANATAGVITGNRPGTPNLLLYQRISTAAAGVRVTGGGVIGAGSATSGSDRQEFTLDVTNAPGGRVFLRDFRFVRSDGSVGSLTADPAVHAATGISSFTRTSAACVTFGGTGRVDTGELVGFTVDACDHGSPGAGSDVFGLTVPYFGYSKSGTLTQGDITLTTF
jgi:subtilisin family serine protease